VCVSVCVFLSVFLSVTPLVISSIGFYYYKCDIYYLEKTSTWGMAHSLGEGLGYVFNYCASLRWVQEHYLCDYKYTE
jgi:hypothetical protein